MTTSRFVQMAAAGVTPSPATDPDFEYVTLLLSGDGTNGAQNNTFIDSSTNNFSITRNGTVTQGSLGPFAKPNGRWSASFGSASTLQYPANTGYVFGTGDFTVECFYYQSTVPAADAETVACQDGSFPHNWQLLTAGGSFGNRLTWAWWGAYNSSTNVPLFQNNRWYHIAVTRSGTTTRLFVDGVQYHSFTDTRDYNANKRLNIGSNKPATLSVSNVRIIKGTALYTENFTPPAAPLTAVTNTTFLGCQSSNFRDNSTTNAAVTVVGTCAVLPFSPFQPTSSYSASTQGGSGLFSGLSANNLTLPASSSLLMDADFTVECWALVQTNTSQALYANIYNGPPGTNASLMSNFNGSNNFEFFHSSPSLRINSGIPARDGAWHHLAVVRSGTTITLYVDGINRGTVTSSANIDWGSASGGRVGEGTDNSGSNMFNGHIANLRIVKGTAVYTANFTPPTSPVTAIAGTSLLLSFANGAVADSAALNDVGTAGAAQISTVQSKWGNSSLSFTGASSALVVADAPQLNFGAGDFTVEFWLYATSVSTQQGLVIKRKTDGGEAGAWGLRLNSNASLGFYDLTAGSTIVEFGTVTANTWTHVAVSRSGSTVRGFVNGTLANSGTSSTNFSNIRQVIVGIWGTFGGVYPSGSIDSQFTGYIDDLRITKGPARYTASFTPPSTAFPTQ